jgi:hypothetical protein
MPKTIHLISRNRGSNNLAPWTSLFHHYCTVCHLIRKVILVWVNRIVDKINNSIGQDPDAISIIGVLDIYGFESFKVNRFAVSTFVTLHNFKYDINSSFLIPGT